MKLAKLKPFYLFLFCICSFTLFAQNTQLAATHDHNHDHDHDHAHHVSSPLKFVKNNNQWHSNIKYSAELGGLNKVYLEDQAFTYLLYAKKETDELHDILKESQEVRDQHNVPGHAYKVHFLNSQKSAFSGHDRRPEYYNYFLGKDENKWASKVPLFEKIVYENVYENIQLAAYSQDGNFKYDFIVGPNADPSQIQLAYEGVEGMRLEDGNLILETSVDEIQELKPYVYQMIDGEQSQVDCKYVLTDNILSFEFPNDYQHELPLIIDPTVVGATLSGSTGTNYGHTATFDNAGNIYAAGIVFGDGYPTTMGAFQMVGAGGIEMGITKYTPDGAAQVYATYLGGSSNDYPHSLIVDFNGQLCVYGSSGSNDFPTTPNAVQPNSGGGTDIVISKLNADGSALVGSTYMGGSETDGQNESFLNSNYGDRYRGEIVLDNQGNIYIASGSNSEDFPVTANAYQTTKSNVGFPAQDGIVAKLNSDLSTLFWSTYLGGDNADICLGLRVDDFQEVYVTGYAGADNFPMVPGGYQSAWPGGQESAFVVKLSTDGSDISKGTFFGTAGDEHSFFIDVDEDNQVHIFGTTTGNVDVTPGAYSFNPGSGQFLAAFNSSLSQLVYSTVIGTGGGTDFVPVAFMVDKCNGIYFSGYQSSEGLPVTADAFQTSGYVFYLGVLEPNAADLSFGTYYGDAYHVDGGTSRFDKSGRVYQAVCSGSGSQMNTTPGAFAEDQIGSWDVGVFKIDFEINTLNAAAFAAPSTSGCAPLTVDFSYTGQNASSILWDFGTTDTSTEFDPTYTFVEPGTYTVMQIVNNPNTCNMTDTFFLQIDVLDDNSTLTETAFCQGAVDLFLDVSTTNATYEWQDGTTGATYQVNVEGTYWVDVFLDGCTRRDSFVVVSQNLAAVDLGGDQGFCTETELLLDAADPNVVSYVWQDGSSDPTFLATSTGEYWVVLIDEFGCETTDTVNIIFDQPPVVDIGEDINVCAGTPFTIDATTPNATYEWQDGSTDPTFTSDQAGVYSVIVNVFGCIDSDELLVTVNEPSLTLDLGADQNICDQSLYILSAANPNVESYEWQNGSTDSTFVVTSSGEYSVLMTDIFGCTYTDTIVLNLNNTPVVDLGDAELNVCQGNEFTLDVTTPNATYLWQDGSTDPIYTSDQPGLYSVIVDVSGCVDSAELLVTINEPSLTLDLGEDQNFCDQNLYILSAANPNVESYEWQNGSTDSTLVVTSSGEYSVLMTDIFGCSYMDTILLNFNDTPEIDLGDVELNICVDSEFTLDVTTPNATYIWQDGSTDPTYTGDEAGTYIVTVDVVGCSATDSVEVIVNEPSLNVDLGDDGIFCDVSEFVLDATDGDIASYEWQDNSNNPTYVVTESGEYSIMVVDVFGCSYVDTINLVFNEAPMVDLGADQIICNGDQFMFDATVANATYTWQDGSTDPTYTATEAGTYTVTVELLGCSTEGEVNVDVITVPLELDEMQTICNVPTITINATSDDDVAYTWNTLDTTASILVQNPGTYTVSAVDDNGCETTESINVALDPNAPSLGLNVTADTTIIVGNTYQMDLVIENVAPPYDGYIIEWSPAEGLNCTDCPNPTVTPTTAGEDLVYTVTVTNPLGPNCNDVATVRVTPVLDCTKVYEVPNAFTPDGDGINDTFSVATEGLRDVLFFEIYNRWGKKVYTSTGLDSQWDGTIDGTPAPSDVYIYMMRVECPDFEEELLHGDVTLIR